jgi:hypothetical protein
VSRAARAFTLAALALACAHGGRVATASPVAGGAHCGREERGAVARFIGTEQAYRAALAAGGLPPGGAPRATPIDFASEGVLLVEMGQRPTAGYALALAAPEVRVVDGVATVAVRFDAPPAGAMVAQVVTSPCLLVRLPRAGLRELRVVDASGALRATARVP